MPKWPIWRVLEKTLACSQTVLPDRSIINWTNVDGKCQNTKIAMENVYFDSNYGNFFGMEMMALNYWIMESTIEQNSLPKRHLTIWEFRCLFWKSQKVSHFENPLISSCEQQYVVAKILLLLSYMSFTSNDTSRSQKGRKSWMNLLWLLLL